jgi:hypothetical protein
MSWLAFRCVPRFDSISASPANYPIITSAAFSHRHCVSCYLQPLYALRQDRHLPLNRGALRLTELSAEHRCQLVRIPLAFHGHRGFFPRLQFADAFRELVALAADTPLTFLKMSSHRAFR